MADAAKWYVVHTYSGYETSSQLLRLKRRSKTAVCTSHHRRQHPDREGRRGKDGKPCEVERKLYPGYVLVKMVMTDETWYLVRNTRGCTGFLGRAGSVGRLQSRSR